jgi:hypothetical protein
VLAELSAIEESVSNLFTCMKVRLAKEARELAVQAMQKEPQDDLAHHLMGRQGLPGLCPHLYISPP